MIYLFSNKHHYTAALLLCTLLIGLEGAQTPAGSARQVRPRRRFGGEEAHRPPRGKQSAWNGKQQFPSTNKLKKTADDSIFKQLWLYGALTLSTLLIGMKGAQTPAGSAGQVRPRRRFSAEEAHRPPRGKRSAWNGKQQNPFTSKLKKTVNKLPFSLGLSTV
ncbi:Ribose 5-phosphate isomerase B [Bacillus badius]|uniref:Ribose 5-phosphate isomerase B n=1 Tax=Bacillus badius TaxID=1455 RepID=A0ABR5ASE3_BACBA|nr:Ribose 5-phosphate isomerase B [Bacillus badius]